MGRTLLDMAKELLSNPIISMLFVSVLVIVGWEALKLALLPWYTVDYYKKDEGLILKVNASIWNLRKRAIFERQEYTRALPEMDDDEEWYDSDDKRIH